MVFQKWHSKKNYCCGLWSFCVSLGGLLWQISHPPWSRCRLTCAFIRPRTFGITVAELHQMKLAVRLPGAGRTARHLLWVPELSSQCALSVSLCVDHTDVPCNNGWTDLDAVLGAYSWVHGTVGIKIGQIHSHLLGWQVSDMAFCQITLDTCYNCYCSYYYYKYSDYGDSVMNKLLVHGT